MTLYPVMFNLQGRHCVVVGGGKVACRKLTALLAAGAQVTLIAPECQTAPVDDNFIWLPRRYQSGDLAGAMLVFAATDDVQVDQAVIEEARQKKIPVNAASCGDAGDFQLPAVRQLGGLTLAVSTAGASPALSVVLADQLWAELGNEWAIIVQLAAALRERALTGRKAEEYNQSILRLLLDEGLEQLIRKGNRDDIDRLLQQVCGADCSLKELGIELPE